MSDFELPDDDPLRLMRLKRLMSLDSEIIIVLYTSGPGSIFIKLLRSK